MNGKGIRQKKPQILLPELQDVTVIQPTRVTNGKYPYTLLHRKIFCFVIFELQKHIRQIANGTKIEQLDIFVKPTENIVLQLPLKYIGRPSQYPSIRDAAEEMCKILIKIPDQEKKERKISGLFALVSSAEPGHYSNFITIEMRRDVATLIMDIPYRWNNRLKRETAHEYTEYFIAVVAQCKNKYSSAIYQMISSYQDKGGFQIKVDELKERLGIPAGQYSNYSDFRKRVLEPVQAELKKFADCWFNCSWTDFEIKDGKKVTELRFKIISHDYAKLREAQVQNLKYRLQNVFKFSPGYMDQCKFLFEDHQDLKAINDKIEAIAVTIAKAGHDIANKQAYALKSLKSEFEKSPVI